MRTHTKLVAAVAALAGALLLPALATAAPTPLVAPALPGVAALPGPLAAPATAAANMTTLTVNPDDAVAGTQFTITGRRTAREQGRLDRLGHGERDVGRRRPARQRRLPRPLGLEDQRRARPGDRPTRQGKLTVKLTAPRDFGGIHDIYAVVDGVQVAKGGFLVARSATMSPKRARSAR